MFYFVALNMFDFKTPANTNVATVEVSIDFYLKNVKIKATKVLLKLI